MIDNITLQNIDADWTPEQARIVLLILDRNKLIKRVSRKTRELIRNIIMHGTEGQLEEINANAEEHELIMIIREMQHEITERVRSLMETRLQPTIVETMQPNENELTKCPDFFNVLFSEK